MNGNGSSPKIATVLVVDDNEDLCDLLNLTLSFDYNVFTAENGEQAIEILTQHPVDAIILDIELPVTNGFEALRIIRDKENGWPDTTVIMLTVCKEPESVLKAWNIGAEYYMTKPFSPAELLTVLQKALRESNNTAIA